MAGLVSLEQQREIVSSEVSGHPGEPRWALEPHKHGDNMMNDGHGDRYEVENVYFLPDELLNQTKES